ncbi:sugar efflux transporter [Nitzschia inconspicua]|uniref:Sugar transporter SWEET1 n=1 Tax=Nitzschia inconspicua TaxID=303405 RepID=A0A9K3LJM9_9STRA|nr:sugar efflux transporter [Nitzschia inconspicua]
MCSLQRIVPHITGSASSVQVSTLDSNKSTQAFIRNTPPSPTALKMVTETAVAPWVSACSNSAPAASMVLLLAPMLTIKQVVSSKSVGNLPLLPYSSMVANCFLWTAYGILLQQSKLWATNGIGLILGLIYFLQFIKFSPPKAPTLPGSIRQHAQAVSVIVFGTFGWCAKCYLTSQKVSSWPAQAAKLVGNAAVVLCLVMFASPLSALKTVLKTKSAKSIPLPFTLATVLNCFLWAVAGLKDFHDFNVYFPNLVGLGLGLTQVGLKLVYGDGPKSGTTMTKAESEVELSM